MSGPPAKKSKFQNKKKFFQPNKKQYLEIGHKGFIATCNFDEKQCVRECYNLLNEFANDLYGTEDGIGGAANIGNENENDVDAEEILDDIADELKKQVDATQEKGKSLTKRRFQCVDTGATNCVFIKTTLEDPVSMADHIVKNIAETKKQKTRHLLRLVPVEVVCKANQTEIVNSAGQLCDKYFLKEPTTFSIVFNKRFNNDINRDSIIREIADLIHAKNLKHKVDLKNAKKSLIVEVIKGLCCLSVVNDYMAMKKYNLVELARTNPEYVKDEEFKAVDNNGKTEDEIKESAAAKVDNETKETVTAKVDNDTKETVTAKVDNETKDTVTAKADNDNKN